MSCILTIDDRPLNRQFLVSLLTYGGHEVLEAADGEEGMEIVRKCHPDLVITDIKMPTIAAKCGTAGKNTPRATRVEGQVHLA